MSTDPADLRPWSAADLLSVSEAASRVPIREADAVELVERVAHPVPGRPDRRLVVWGDVLDLLRGDEAPPPLPAPRRGTLPRAGLPRR